MVRAFIFLIIIFIINIPSLYYGWYLKWDWFDILLHFLGGFFVSKFMFYYLKDRLMAGEWIKNTLIIVGATIFVGVIWEFAEYIANQTLVDWTYATFKVKAYFMGDLEDTVMDLVMDTLGALAFIIISLNLKLENQNETRQND